MLQTSLCGFLMSCTIKASSLDGLHLGTDHSMNEPNLFELLVQGQRKTEKLTWGELCGKDALVCIITTLKFGFIIVIIIHRVVFFLPFLRHMHKNSSGYNQIFVWLCSLSLQFKFCLIQTVRDKVKTTDGCPPSSQTKLLKSGILLSLSLYSPSQPLIFNSKEIWIQTSETQGKSPQELANSLLASFSVYKFDSIVVISQMLVLQGY